MRLVPILMIATSLATTAHAGSKGGVIMPNTIKVAGKTLTLNGMGIREATVFMIDVYVAGLYLEAKSKDAKAIIASDTTKRIVMKFVRDVDRDDLVKAWKKGFGRSSALKDRVKKLNSFMSDIEERESMIFTYVPGKGTEVSVKGKSKGVLAGTDFISALFNIWLGPKPPNSGLRSGMLGI